MKEQLRKIKHGFARQGVYNRLYEIWLGMKKRCYNKNCKRYKNYGGRGIIICDEWVSDYLIFYNWAMENGYKNTLSIDRINNDGNYEPNNCRWATAKEQNLNTSVVLKLEVKGHTGNIDQLYKIFFPLPITVRAVKDRYYTKKWSIEDSLFSPNINKTHGKATERARIHNNKRSI